jgi:hypothetical protein
MSKLSGNPFVSHGRIQDTMTMTYDILAIGVKWGSVSPPFYFSLRTGSLEEDSGGRGREGEGGEGVDPGIGCPFPGSWILDGNKVRIRYTGSGVGMNSLALFLKA